MSLISRILNRGSLPIETPVDRELVDITRLNGIAAAIEMAMRKSLNYANFEAFESGIEQGNYFGTEFDIRSTAGRIKGLYSREPWVYTTATLIARTLATVPFKLYRKGTDVWERDHPLQKLVNSGNQIQDAFTTRWAGFLDLVLGGNEFIVIDNGYREQMVSPVEYCSLKLPDKAGDPQTLLVYNPTKLNMKTEVDFKHFIHMKLPNPFNPFYGLSPFCAAARPILLDRFKNEFELAFYLRGATHAGVIECTEDLSRSRMERLMRTWEAAFTGKRNWFRTIFLPKGSKWVSASLSMAETQHLEGLRENRLTILAVLGVPPAKAGIMQDANYSNSEEQDKTFYENTIVPYSGFYASGWNNSYIFKTLYQGLYELRPDFSNVSALEGSHVKKGEQAKGMQPFFYIDEIRRTVWKVGPLPNGAGQAFASASAASNPLASLGLLVQQNAPQPEAPAPQPAEPESPPPAEPAESEEAKAEKDWQKALVITSQNRIEDRLSPEYAKALDAYIDLHVAQAVDALLKHRDVRQYLAAHKDERELQYWGEAEAVLNKAMERGFSFADANVKAHNPRTKTNVDREAIDVLHERTEEGQRKVLKERSLRVFYGFDETTTDNILTQIERMYAAGSTLSDVARNLAREFGENYGNQARTITRTELLSAVSVGMKWHQDILGQVYSKVQKQWLSQQDEFVRDSHLGFEDEGVVELNHQYAPGLSYPRELGGPAEEVINCRCSMVDVIPEDAISNAPAILEKDF